MCAYVGGGGGGGGGGSIVEGVTDTEQVRRERVQVQFTVRLHMASTFDKGIRKIYSYRRGEYISLQPNPGPPVDDSVLCGPLQGLFLRRGIAGSGDS